MFLVRCFRSDNLIMYSAGFQTASTVASDELQNDIKPRLAGLAAAVAFFAACFTFPGLGVEAHSPFLFGLGNLPSDVVQSFSFVSLFLFH